MRCTECGAETEHYVKDSLFDGHEFGEIKCWPRCESCAKDAEGMIPATKQDYVRFYLEELLAGWDTDFKDLLEECGPDMMEAAFKEILKFK
jgi:hypothetical protein